MEAWLLGMGANSVIAFVYLVIGWLILSALVRSGQAATNRMGMATGMVFIACAAGNALIVAYLLLPYVDLGGQAALAARIHYSAWVVWTVDAIAACAGLSYLVLRLGAVRAIRRSLLFDDLRRRRLQALEIHDNIIQGLVEAKLALEHDDRDATLRTLEETLGRSRRIMSDLLDENGQELAILPGELRRTTPAGGAA